MNRKRKLELFLGSFQDLIVYIVEIANEFEK